MNIGQSIKNLREKKGYNQKNFAEMCAISPSYLSQIEQNQKTPHTGALKKISETLDIPLPIIYFLSMEEDDVKTEKKQYFSDLINPFKSMIETFFLQQ